MKKLTLILCLILSMFATSALAQSGTTKVTIDLDDLDPATAAQVLEAKQKAEGKSVVEESATAVEVAEEWAVFGERFGQVIASICKELGIAVNDFINTPVGKLAAVMIVWKVVGDDLWSIIGGTSAWILITMILMWSYRHFHMRQKIKGKDGDVTYVERFEFSKPNYQLASSITHASIFVIFTATCMGIVFS